MNQGADFREVELEIDAADLYREEIFTDRRVGTLRRLTPVTKDGDEDRGRPVRFVGQAQLWTQMGPLPITFEVDASDLESAVRAFPEAARIALEQTMEEARELRRQQASQIVVPEMGGGGGGKIQLP